MKTLIRSWVLSALSVVTLISAEHIFAAGREAPATDAAGRSSTVVWFLEKEAGTDWYPVRMIVTNRYLRIDEDDDAGDFVLFDRLQKTISSVSRENESVLVITNEQYTFDEPARFDLRVQEMDSEGSPSIHGSDVRVFRFYTNDALCVEVASAAGLLEDVITVLGEFHRALASEHAWMARHTPDAMRYDCEVSDLIVAPDRYLRFGFPVHQRDHLGKTRALREFDSDHDVDPRLFELPLRYHRFTTQEFRG